MIVKARVPVPNLAAGAQIRAGGDVAFDGYPGLCGTVVCAEVVDDGWLELEIEIAEQGRIAYLLRAGSIEGLSA